MVDVILLESGDKLLLETGDFVLLEIKTSPNIDSRFILTRSPSFFTIKSRNIRYLLNTPERLTIRRKI